MKIQNILSNGTIINQNFHNMKQILLSKISLLIIGTLMVLSVVIKLFYRDLLTDKTLAYISGIQVLLIGLFILIEIVKRTK